MPEEKKLVFTKDPNQLKIQATAPDGQFIYSNTVEALLLFDIRHLLDEIRMGLIDVEDTIEKKS